MFEDDSSKTLNNKLVQDSNITEDMFEESDIINTSNIIRPGGVAPAKPIKNYNELIQEVEKDSNKINIKYFFIGFFVVVIIIVSFVYFFYNKIFKTNNDSGDVVINTESPILNIENNINTEKIDQKKIDGVKVNSSAISNDIDGDGLSNEEEKILGTDPDKTDTDYDGLSDRQEVKVYQTDPLNKDTDGDGYSDGEEVKNAYNPRGEGKLFDFNFNIIKNTETKKEKSDVQSLIEYSNSSFSFKYPNDWVVTKNDNKTYIKNNSEDYIEIDERENKLELDLIDWIVTQEDYPDFTQEQINFGDKNVLVVKSTDPEWKAFLSVLLSIEDSVYIFNYFSKDDAYIDILKDIVISFTEK